MVIAGIVAGGTGSRMGNSTVPKQFMELGGKPIIIHTIEAFLQCPDIDTIVIGIHADWQEYLEHFLHKYIKNFNIQKNPCHAAEYNPANHRNLSPTMSGNIYTTPGGADRNSTIRAILDKAAMEYKLDDDTIIVTHDAVRPFITPEIIHENVEATRKYAVCGTAISATDTILYSDDHTYITDIPQRDKMYQAQTPQSFRYGLYREVCSRLSQEEMAQATDVCSLFHQCHHPVYLVDGDVRNFKITYPSDLALAESLLSSNIKPFS